MTQLNRIEMGQALARQLYDNDEETVRWLLKKCSPGELLDLSRAAFRLSEIAQQMKLEKEAN